jgi:hypothetical protein
MAASVDEADNGTVPNMAESGKGQPTGYVGRKFEQHALQRRARSAALLG